VVEIHPFMLKNLDGCVYHGSKPAYSFPMLIIREIGKLLYSWTDVDETWYIASYDEDKKLGDSLCQLTDTVYSKW
jgi:hypothetical protein